MGSIVDNRVPLGTGDAANEYDDLTGAAAGTQDVEIFVEGTASNSYYTTTSRDGLLYDAGAAQNWSDNVFYIWFQCQVAGLLESRLNGGVTVRFCGATVTDWFEVYVDGNDTYSGGWKMLVVDIERARDIAVNATESPQLGGTGGTPPATTAIRYVGVTTITSATMPRKVDNTFMDACWRLPKGSPGIIVQGHSAPGVPYNWDDIEFAGSNSDASKAWGMISKENGVFFLNAPIQFGNKGSPVTSPANDHDFEDSNVVVAWESNIVYDGFYGLTVVGDSAGVQRFVQGVNGSAGQGLTMLADADGPRWFFDASDADIDTVGLYGCSFSHTEVIDIDNALVDVYDSLLIDGQRLYHSRAASPRSGADFRRNAIIQAAPIYGEGSPEAITSPANRAYLWTADPDKIQDCTFNFSSDHAMRIDATGAFNFIGNVFTGQWLDLTSPDGQQTLNAGLLVIQGGLILNVSGAGSTPTQFDFGSPIAAINNNISVTVTNLIPGTEVRVYPSQDFNSPNDLTEIGGVESSGSPSEFTFSAPAGTVVDIVVFNVNYVLPPDNRVRNFTVPTTDTSFPVSQILDRNFSNP
jgi:hypothetical protein